jgi:hypothetical protein
VKKIFLAPNWQSPTTRCNVPTLQHTLNYQLSPLMCNTTCIGIWPCISEHLIWPHGLRSPVILASGLGLDSVLVTSHTVLVPNMQLQVRLRDPDKGVPLRMIFSVFAAACSLSGGLFHSGNAWHPFDVFKAHLFSGLSRAYAQASTPLSSCPRMCKGVLDKLQLEAEVQSGYCKRALVSKPVAPYTAGHEKWPTTD